MRRRLDHVDDRADGPCEGDRVSPLQRREFGILRPAASLGGRDVLLVVLADRAAAAEAASLRRLDDVTIRHGEDRIFCLALLYGTDFRPGRTSAVRPPRPTDGRDPLTRHGLLVRPQRRGALVRISARQRRDGPVGQ